jgi:nitrogen-specific signal transduction histidine kinase
MTPLHEWLKPPRSLLVYLFVLTLFSVSALAVFGWRLLTQERMVETQRVEERLEQAADRITATLRGTLAETGERVAAPRWDPKGEEGLLLQVGANSLAALPRGRLLYWPVAASQPEAPAAAFAEGEHLEFQDNDARKAAEVYRRMSVAPDAALRAGALLRLARVYRRSGDFRAAEAYSALSATLGAKVAGVAAELVALQALAELSARRDIGGRLLEGLRAARWQLTRGQFEYYWGEAARWVGERAAPPPEAVALADTVGQIWNERDRENGARGQRTVWVDGFPFLLIWRETGGTPGVRRAVFIARPETILKQVLAGDPVVIAATDSEGRVVAGRKGSVSSGLGRAVVRTAAESQLPWTIYVAAGAGSSDPGTEARRRFLMLATTIMVLFLIVGTYFVARAIRREAEVARMQSEFVSAVSHEFRSPLTSMRQLSEMLALGRVPQESRREVYYQTLVRETSRLQRLVEALLNFGRMEAGARQYHFEELNAASLVHRVVSEFEPQLASVGRHIELDGAEEGCRIEADPEAMSVALRNLVDNALKYSWNKPAVWVEWEKENERIAIRVRDLGAGIAPAEMKAIFRKFVRGSAAAAGNVKGSGVGLAMVRHIVAAHGGEIRVKSKPGEGSTFTVLLRAVNRA